ncbi:hypothetical protein LTR94_027672 [Friedmanniomyces endolithicus]|nr:hypothetical protein LTR94_027672 [Friedmanniomyces endolithicus]
MKSGSGFGSQKTSSAKAKTASPFEAERQAAQRAALNALKRARRSAEKAGVSLSEWEDGFLNDVDARVRTHGRAFADPEKGGPGRALSILQGRKLREIEAKAKKAGAAKDQAEKADEDDDASEPGASARWIGKPNPSHKDDD